MRNILNHEPDLVARMRRMKPKEGVNVVHSFARRGKRLRLAAVVNKKGQIVDWAATRKSEDVMLRRIGPLIALTLLTGCSDALGLEEGEVLDMVGQWSLEMRWYAGSKERCSASVRMAIEEQHVASDSLALLPLSEVFSGVTMDGRAGCDSQTPFEIELQPGILSGFVTRISPVKNQQRVWVNFCIEARYLGRSTAPERPGVWIACLDGVMWQRANLESSLGRMTFRDDGPISFDESYGSLFTLRRR